MTFADGQQNNSPKIDVKITIPEMAAVGPFWIRGYPTHRSFADLYQECVNHQAVLASPFPLEPVRASRHFWIGDQMMRRGDSLNTVASRPAKSAAGPTELSLFLRRDYYRIGPVNLIAGGIEYTYIDAEDRVDNVLPSILDKDQRTCCFDLCDWHHRRLAPDKSLADYALWPAWQDASEFPGRANLSLRPRAGRLAYLLLACAALGGFLTGYGFWRFALAGH